MYGTSSFNLLRSTIALGSCDKKKKHKKNEQFNKKKKLSITFKSQKMTPISSAAPVVILLKSAKEWY